MHHTSIIITSELDKPKLISSLLSNNCPKPLEYLNDLKGSLFSSSAIESIIKEELKHDILKVSNRPLQSFSSGERKKKFLQYLLKNKPDYLILDSIFDHLDQESKETIKQELHTIAKQVHLIQIESREKNVIPFIKNRIQIPSCFLKPIGTNTNNIVSSIPKLTTSVELKTKEIIRFESVSLSYLDKPILNSITWTINQGDFWQLIGPNGSGKSTILSMITGDNPKAYGQNLYLFGRKKGSGESINDIKKNIGYFNPSITELFWRFQSIDHMILSGFYDSIGLYTKPSSLQKKIADQWLKVINLSAEKNKPFIQLPRAKQRMVLIIRAIIKQPPLLILDEPLEGLDEDGVSLVCELINQIKETKTTIIYVSHEVEKRIVPEKVFELLPTPSGSIGKQIT